MPQVDNFADKRAIFERRFKAKPTNGTLMLLDSAEDEAVGFSHNYVGTEHLLLGAMLTPESRLPLLYLGVTLETVRSKVGFVIGRGDREVRRDQIGLTPRAKKVMTLSVEEAKRLQDTQIEPGHIVLGLVREGEGIGAGMLESLGVSLTKVRSLVIQERRQRAEADRLEATSPASAAFANLADVRLLLLNPDITPGAKENIGAVLKQLNQTYSPKQP